MRKPRKKSIHWIWDGEHKKKQDVVDTGDAADMTDKVLAVLTAEEREQVLTYVRGLQDIEHSPEPAAADRQTWNAPH